MAVGFLAMAVDMRRWMLMMLIRSCCRGCRPLRIGCYRALARDRDRGRAGDVLQMLLLMLRRRSGVQMILSLRRLLILAMRSRVLKLLRLQLARLSTRSGRGTGGRRRRLFAQEVTLVWRLMVVGVMLLLLLVVLGVLRILPLRMLVMITGLRWGVILLLTRRRGWVLLILRVVITLVLLLLVLWRRRMLLVHLAMTHLLVLMLRRRLVILLWLRLLLRRVELILRRILLLRRRIRTSSNRTVSSSRWRIHKPTSTVATLILWRHDRRGAHLDSNFAGCWRRHLIFPGLLHVPRHLG